MKDFMKINENDNVIVALKEMKKGEKISLENTEIEALETIPAGHKMAVKDICEGADVIKYVLRRKISKRDSGFTRTISKLHLEICWNTNMNRYTWKKK